MKNNNDLKKKIFVLIIFINVVKKICSSLNIFFFTLTRSLENHFILFRFLFFIFKGIFICNIVIILIH